MSTVAQVCGQCASELPPGARFCPECGTPTREAHGSPRASSPPTGERRQVAILFADLSGYTRLSRSVDAEETHRLLTRFFESADAAIERFGGTIDKHIGDAVMGVFGAPVAYGNDVERALRAAIAIHQAMAALSSEVERPLATHIGIASGEVVAAATGSNAHRSYTVTGDAVNLASRLTDFATSGETILSEDVQRAVGWLADTEALGEIALPGLGDAIRAFRLVALRGSPRAVPFVGREDERRRFATLLARAQGERIGAVALVSGDPGMGKSRLAEALLSDADASGLACHVATVLDFGVGQAGDAIHALVASLLGIPSRAGAAASRDALDRAVAEGRAELDDEPYLADLLLIPQRPGSLYEAMDNDARQAGKLRAVTRLAERAADAGPCVLLIEDVHWASRWVLECATAIASVAPGRPLLLVMTSRRDGDPITSRWPSGAVVRFDLPPLERSEALALAQAHLVRSAELAARCVERAQGNPLFLTQLIESDDDGQAVPPTIQSAVLARLDRLPPRDKSALQAAAVIGQRFPLDLLRHLLRDPGYVPDVPVARDLVRADPRDPAFLLFRHALIRDGAYASLLRSARRKLHHAAAEWYESRDPTLYAEHLERAEDPRAAEAYLVAARGEAHAMRIEAALALASRGVDLASGQVRFDLASLVGELEHQIGDAQRSIAAFENARDAAVDDAQRCVAWIGIASGHRMTSAVAAGLAALDRATAFAGGQRLLRERARIAYLRGSLHFARGDIDACRLPHEEALALAREAGDTEIEAWALSGLADARYAKGAMRSARDAFLGCIEICEREAMTRFSLMNHCMVAIIDAYLLRIDDARARLARTRRLARDVRHRLAETMCEESEAFIFVIAGRPGEAASSIARGLPLARAIGARRFETLLLVSAAHLAWREGRSDDAQAQLQSAWSLSEEVGARFAGPIVLGTMARFAQTEDARSRALHDGERLLRAPCVSHCYTGFYIEAIEAALSAGEWSAAARYADLLDDYTRAEPLPLVDLLVTRGRMLAASGRGDADRAELLACRRNVAACGLTAYLPALDAALARAR